MFLPKKNIARIAKRCPEKITSVVKCVELLFPKNIKRVKKSISSVVNVSKLFLLNYVTIITVTTVTITIVTITTVTITIVTTDTITTLTITTITITTVTITTVTITTVTY